MNRQERRAQAKQIAGAVPPAAAQALAEALRLHQAGRYAEALPAYRRSLAAAPRQPDVLQNLGSALNELGRPAEALAAFDRALALRPAYPIAHLNRGNALWALGRPEEALAAYGRAIEQRPDFAWGYDARALVLAGEGRFAAALADAEAAVRLAPAEAQPLNTRGNVLRALGRLEEAAASYRQAIALAPDYADGHFNLSQALLAAGRFAEAWEPYEWRWRTPQMSGQARRFPQPLWAGQAGTGQRLLVHAEQGQGDVIQFCRYLPLLAARGFTVLFEVPRSLARLCASLPGIAEVIVQGEPLPGFDLHSPLMSLPLRFGTVLETIPSTTPYLAADAAATAAWQARLAALGPGLRVGLAWAGNPSPERPARAAMDRRRSIAPGLLAPLWAVPGVHFVSLQKGGPALPLGQPTFDAMAEMADFADTAALVAALDLVIAVDSAVAHLAGSLGRPVWLLDRFDPCWRWLLGRQDSPWYPGLTIFRQSAPGDWPGVVHAVAAALGAAQRLGGPA